MRLGRGDRFYKMTGSGNDFVAFDRLGEGPDVALPGPELVRALCRRRVGVGADGVLVLTDAADADYRLVYYNADGSRAELCGNASLCGVRLALELGRGSADGLTFVTDAGPMHGRMTDGEPELDLTPPRDLAPDLSWLWDTAGGAEQGDQRLGFVRVGVPHLVVLCSAAGEVDVERRGPPLRQHPGLADGANVNFVSRSDDGTWAMRTFERGVEAETLACGTGSVATALLLTSWGEVAGVQPTGEGQASQAEHGGQAAAPGAARDAAAADSHDAQAVSIRTSSGRLHRVRLRRTGDAIFPSLAGEGRIVYLGELAELV